MRNRAKILVTGDVVCAVAAVYAAYFLRSSESPFQHGSLSPQGFLRGSAVILAVLFSSYLMELYKRDVPFDSTECAARIAVSVNLSFLGLYLFITMVPQMTLGRGLLTYFLLCFGMLQFIWHAGYQFMTVKLDLLPKVLVLGTGAVAVQLGDIVKNLSDNYNFLGFVKENGELAEAPNDTNGVSGSLFETAMRLSADSLVVAPADISGGYPLQEILNCKLHGISVFDAPAFYERVTGKMLIEHITPEWFIFSQGFQISHLKRGIKRCGDILCCLVMLPLLLPFFPLMALIIKLDSPGPLFYRQVRVGENEKPFVLYKLRTMNNDAETQTGAVWAQTDDPRITRVGKFLRKSRLDEFPQLFNVLRGDMSLVGPRPERPEFVEQLQKIITYYSERHLIKPGVTGWAQINYPYGASVEDAIEKLRYDLYYLKNFSIPLDVLISMETIKVVLFGRGSR